MKLFTSATLKLAGWYLLILMSVSLLFSGIIFTVARTEVTSQIRTITKIYRSKPRPDGSGESNQSPRTTESTQTQITEPEYDTENLITSLTYLNLAVLLGGGFVAYLLARRSLKPIEAAHDAQSRFTANASHQLRTPLAIMKAETELALADPKTPKSELRQALQSNLEEINRLNELATMLLELSRSECELGANTVNFDLAEMLRNFVDSRPEKIRVKLNSPESLKITSHRPAVREIIAILLDNASKHSPENSTIKISLTDNKNSVELTVTNGGQGIADKDLPHIFERFYRGRQDSGNYGLGLSLALSLAKALGGQISAKSTPVKQGKQTVFILVLPIG